MSQLSSIEWTDATWNPVRGCVKISPGCKHCYAEAFAERFRGVLSHPYELGFEPRIVPERLLDPLRWVLPRTVFVNSMSDLFMESIPDGYILTVAEVMRRAKWHTFQVLTKRAERLRNMLDGKLNGFGQLPHIWWGVSVENKKHGTHRIDHLRQSPAAVRFLSIEPLLEDLGLLNLDGIDWVIVGGESGRGARRMEAAWVRSVRNQCEVAKVPFFFKQWGGTNKKRTGRILDGRTYDDLPPRERNDPITTIERRRRISELTPLAEKWVGRELLLNKT